MRVHISNQINYSNIAEINHLIPVKQGEQI